MSESEQNAGTPGDVSAEAIAPPVPAVDSSGAPPAGTETVAEGTMSVVSPSASTAHDGDEEDEVAEPTISQETEIPGVLAATAMISLDALVHDDTFRIRGSSESEEEIAKLATDIARLGQLFPIDVRVSGDGKFQVICGFRRVAALRFLKREKVSARLHIDLTDADALLLALAAAIHGKAVETSTFLEWQERLNAEGMMTPAVRDMLEKALATEDSLSPEDNEEEVDADELASDVTARLGQCNQDLSLLADVFTDLEPERRRELLTQLKYSIDLVRFLESKS